MKAIQAYPQQGLDGLTLMDLPDPGDPGPNAIRVRVHATSLNVHDLGVVTGRLPAIDGRIPMADGAGVVEAVGAEVTEFKPGDHVVSTFFPTWLDGEATLANGYPVIDRSFPLPELADTFRLQESGGHFGKIVVEF